MAMPNELVFVRHGQSEGNLAKRLIEQGRGDEIPSEFHERHDWQYRLTSQGVEQAQSAGRWLVDNIGNVSDYFDERYVSSHIRARETALHIGGAACNWLIDDRLPERDWGIYNSVPPNEREEHFPHTTKLRELSSLRWRPDGGEALMSEVLLRFRDWLDTLHREQEGKNVLAVAHGELMWVARYVIERMLPEEWEALEYDDSQRIFNCDIIWYTRTNPEDSQDTRPYLAWRKIIRPTNQGDAPFGGEWVELEGKRRFDGTQLTDGVNAVPQLLSEF